MKLPLTDLFGYIHNWQAWINKDDNWFNTIGGLAVLFNLIAASSTFILCGICDRISYGAVDYHDILDGSFIVAGILLVYVFFAFILNKRYKSFVYDEKYTGRRARRKTLLLLILTIVYTFIGFMSPCYLWVHAASE